MFVMTEVVSAQEVVELRTVEAEVQPQLSSMILLVLREDTTPSAPKEKKWRLIKGSSSFRDDTGS